MSLSIKLRLAALCLAVGLTGVLIVLATLHSQREALVARDRLGQVDLESFRIAEHFRDKLRYANDKMRRYATANDHAAWEEFLSASEELSAWIEQQAPQLKTEAESEVLKRMHSASGVYVQKARELHERMEASHEPGASLAEYNGFFEQSRRFIDLSQDLARAHFDSRNDALVHAGQTLTELRKLVLGTVALLFVFGAALAVVVYRDLIAPLRIRLVESQALAERHEKLAALGLLAAGVAHEIRNPLTAIKTALFIQQKNSPPGSAERGDGELIQREVARLEGIVNDFLQFARPAGPKLALFAADQPLREVRDLLASSLAEAYIRLVYEPCSVQLHIQADPAQIKQVLINLVQNAADSIGRGGVITMRARLDRKRLADHETDVVILEVADTGKGIPPEVQKRLFDPFFTTKETGTGLGLSIAARLVEVNGGALQYQTRVDRGSVFGIVLPRAEETVQR